MKLSDFNTKIEKLSKSKLSKFRLTYFFRNHFLQTLVDMYTYMKPHHLDMILHFYMDCFYNRQYLVIIKFIDFKKIFSFKV